MSIEDKVVKMNVIGKREINRGLIFERKEYFLTLQISEEGATTKPVSERKVDFSQYSGLNVGDTLGIHLYSPDRKNWFFSAEEAEQYRKRTI